MLRERLAKNLKELRQKNKLTQEEAAELCNISPRYLGKIERCEADVTLKTLEKIMSGLNVSVENLLTESVAYDEAEDLLELQL